MIGCHWCDWLSLGVLLDAIGCVVGCCWIVGSLDVVGCHWVLLGHWVLLAVIGCC